VVSQRELNNFSDESRGGAPKLSQPVAFLITFSAIENGDNYSHCLPAGRKVMP